MLAIMMLLVLLPSCNQIRERGLFGKKAKTLEMLRAQQDSIRVADSLKRIEDRQKALEEARLDSIIQAESEKAASDARKRFNIVVGSFITPEYARSFVEEYRKLGYDATIVRREDSDFELVVAESHDRFSEAMMRLEQFQDTVDVFSWLYVKRE